MAGQDKQYTDDADGYYGGDGSLDQEDLDLSFLKDDDNIEDGKVKEDTN